MAVSWWEVGSYHVSCLLSKLRFGKKNNPHQLVTTTKNDVNLSSLLGGLEPPTFRFAFIEMITAERASQLRHRRSLSNRKKRLRNFCVM